MLLLYFILATLTRFGKVEVKLGSEELFKIEELSIEVNVMQSVESVNWKTFRQTEYAFFNMKMSWINAQRHCLRYGAHLAHPDSKDANKFVVTLTDKKTWAWIGGSNLPDKTTWEWHHPLAPISFYYWAKGQPSHAGTEHCITFWNSSDGYKWGDYKCAQNQAFICEGPARKVSADQTTDFDMGAKRKHCMNLCLKLKKIPMIYLLFFFLIKPQI